MDRVPIAYGMARVSSDKQFLSHLSIEHQETGTQQYYEHRLADSGALWGGLFGDDASMTSKVPTLRRPAAIELDRRLQNGDHVICLAVDRLWRDMKDLLAVTERWTKRGVTLHFVREGLVFDGSPIKLFQLQIMTATAQMERAMISQRQKEAYAARRARGETAFGRARYGTQRPKGGKRWENHNEERAIMGLVRHLREVQNWPWARMTLVLGRTVTLRSTQFCTKSLKKIIQRAKDQGITPSLRGWLCTPHHKRKYIPADQLALLEQAGLKDWPEAG